ncbi:MULTISPECIES: hypothetical protein [unclassified Cupriavidus]|uniref:hypothetical protein n=1 Tax=unclassified Cupriavidus TaxID=2640874 RepID=UPI0014859BA0|nr:MULTISPECIES: hypothetical protein [unclassified Cupriavidus]
MPPVMCSSLPRGSRLTPPSFPILTLDEGRLTPALGYLFNKKWIEPYESLVSILWKFEKANALPGHVVARLLGADIDPYEGVVPQLGLIDLRRLHDTLAIPIQTLRLALVQPSQRRRYCSVFRHCHSCMLDGYHSVLHQIESIAACPAHRKPLENSCRRCGHEAPYLLNIRLLESPYRCAHCRATYGGKGWSPDHVRPMKAEARKSITRRYFDLHFG